MAHCISVKFPETQLPNSLGYGFQNKIQTLYHVFQGPFPFPPNPIPALSLSLSPFLQTHTPISSEGKDCGPQFPSTEKAMVGD